MTESTRKDRHWALITGASSGFGVDFARRLAAAGNNLVLVARRKQPMDELADDLRRRHGIDVHVEAIDLLIPDASSELKRRTDEYGIQIRTLVNNAGYGVFGAFVDRPMFETIDMLRVNMVALTELTHLYASDMIKRGDGQILLVSSIGAYQATPTYAAYAASKSYVLLFGEALHEELKPHGVTVTVASPGISETNFLAVSGQKATAYQRLVMMTSERVVDIALSALRRGRASIVPGVVNALTVGSNRLMPRIVQRKMAFRLMKNG